MRGEFNSTVGWKRPRLDKARSLVISELPAARQLLRTVQSVHAWALLTSCLFILFLTRVSAINMLVVFRLATGVVIAGMIPGFLW